MALLARISPQGSGPVDVFRVRAERAVQLLAENMSRADLEKAASEPSDIGVILSALQSDSGIAVLPQDPLARARLRGIRMKRELLEREGGVLSGGEVAELLGLQRQAINKRVKARSLLALETAKHGYSYPAWQFVEGDTLPGLVEVLRSLDPTIDPWMALAFFLNGNVALDGASPLEALRKGDRAGAVRAARSYGQHGAA